MLKNKICPMIITQGTKIYNKGHHKMKNTIEI